MQEIGHEAGIKLEAWGTAAIARSPSFVGGLSALVLRVRVKFLMPDSFPCFPFCFGEPERFGALGPGAIHAPALSMSEQVASFLAANMPLRATVVAARESGCGSLFWTGRFPLVTVSGDLRAGFTRFKLVKIALAATEIGRLYGLRIPGRDFVFDLLRATNGGVDLAVL